MSDLEIVTKAIEKAEVGGWSFDQWMYDNWSVPRKEDFLKRYPQEDWDDIRKQTLKVVANNYWKVIVFDLDFAKALWGEDKVLDGCPACEENYGGETHRPEWEINLMEMSITEDRLKYLEHNL